MKRKNLRKLSDMQRMNTWGGYAHILAQLPGFFCYCSSQCASKEDGRLVWLHWCVLTFVSQSGQRIPVAIAGVFWLSLLCLECGGKLHCSSGHVTCRMVVLPLRILKCLIWSISFPANKRMIKVIRKKGRYCSWVSENLGLKDWNGFLESLCCIHPFHWHSFCLVSFQK